MAVKGAATFCATSTLPQARKQILKQKQSQNQKDKLDSLHIDHFDIKLPIAQGCLVSSQLIKYWLTASFCLNALFLSALLGLVAPINFLTKQANETIVANGAGHAHKGLHNQHCTGQGHYEYEDVNGGTCRCYSCFTGSSCAEIIADCTINFDHGDPKMFENYWSTSQNAISTVLLGGDRMSYFSYTDAVCWFLEPSLAAEIKLTHNMVGNAVTDGYHIVVGTGSSQLISAALYALSLTSHERPVDVISAAPFYSSYPPMTDLLKSQLHRWAGDALSYKVDSQSMYIELVTSPGNPDGMPHTAVVNGTGTVIYDLAYYWPHYTPILSAADYDIMLFTISKTTGHAGTRVG